MANLQTQAEARATKVGELLDRQSPGGVDLDHHRTLEQFDADYQARGLGLAEHDTLKALERTID
jgi:hypothetical protein